MYVVCVNLAALSGSGSISSNYILTSIVPICPYFVCSEVCVAIGGVSDSVEWI